MVLAAGVTAAARVRPVLADAAVAARDVPAALPVLRHAGRLEGRRRRGRGAVRVRRGNRRS